MKIKEVLSTSLLIDNLSKDRRVLGMFAEEIYCSSKHINESFIINEKSGMKYVLLGGVITKVIIVNKLTSLKYAVKKSSDKGSGRVDNRQIKEAEQYVIGIINNDEIIFLDPIPSQELLSFL